MKPWILVASLSVAATLSGCHEPSISRTADAPVSAELITVSSSSKGGEVQVSGVVKSHLEADLSAQIVAPIAAITKREGDHFRKGEVLVRLHAPALVSGVAQATAALSSAEQQSLASRTQAVLAADTLARYALLRERHSVTAHELDEVKAQTAMAQAQEQSAEAEIRAASASVAMQRASAADAVLLAPFDGVVSQRMADPGAMAAPGVPILHLQSTGLKEVELSVPDTLLRDLKVGSALPVGSSDSSTSSAQVTVIAPGSDPGSHSFLVKATLPITCPWTVGTVVQVALPSAQSSSAISIPSTALIQQGSLDAVVAVDGDGRGSVRYVTIGWAQGDSVQILSGLRQGERIATRGNLALAGRKIEARP